MDVVEPREVGAVSVAILREGPQGLEVLMAQNEVYNYLRSRVRCCPRRLHPLRPHAASATPLLPPAGTRRMRRAREAAELSFRSSAPRARCVGRVSRALGAGRSRGRTHL